MVEAGNPNYREAPWPYLSAVKTPSFMVYLNLLVLAIN
jgi:hypothetical protein